MQRSKWHVLFSEYDLRSILENQLARVRELVFRLDRAEFDRRSDEEIAASIASALVVNPLVLDEENITVSRRHVQVDVSHDFERSIYDRSKPFYVEGVEVMYHLPYSGHEELLRCRPNTFTANPPRAVVAEGELRYPYNVPNGRDVAETKTAFLRDLGTLKEWVPWVNRSVEEYNATLESSARQRVTERRAEIEKTETDVSALGFKVRSAPTSSVGSQHGPASAPERRRRRDAARRKYDVALSFAGEDREFVQDVADRLRELEVEVFYDGFEEADLWGKDLVTHLAEVYGQQSRFVVIFASKHYAEKAWPNHEREHALARHFRGERERVLPVRMDNTEIPGLPSTVGYLDRRVLTAEKLAELIRQKVDADPGRA